jgi:hypothetical protein
MKNFHSWQNDLDGKHNGDGADDSQWAMHAMSEDLRKEDQPSGSLEASFARLVRGTGQEMA